MAAAPHQITLPCKFAYAPVHTYLFLEPEPTLIDCGEKSPQSWNALQKGLGEFGLSIKDLKKIIITHPHVDHIGMAQQIAEESQAEVWVSDLVYDWAVNPQLQWDKRTQVIDSVLRKGGIPKELSNNIQSGFKIVMNAWEAIDAKYIKVFKTDQKIEIGKDEWQVMPMFGHSQHQTCFYQPETESFIAADMLLDVTPVPVIEPNQNYSQRMKSLPQMMDSYKKLSQLALSHVYPGHGRNLPNPHQTIENQVNRIHMRKEECLTYVRKGIKSVFEIAQLMYPNLNGFALMMGFGMTLGYLDLLEIEEKLNFLDTEKEFIYQAI